MSVKIIGTCSECGGPVVVPVIWYGVKPPIPYCENCGATAKRDYGPVIPMNPPKRGSKWTNYGLKLRPDEYIIIGIENSRRFQREMGWKN